MCLLAPLSLVLALGAQLPLPQAEAPGSERAELKADQLVYEPSRQVVTARGHAVLRSDGMVLRADELTYDQSQERAVARGGVTFVSGLVAAVADEISVDLNTQEATVRGGLFMQKRKVSPEALLAAESADELKALGETTVALTGSRIRRIGPDQFEVDGLSFTPCDCKPTQPVWRIEARHAQVKVGENAVLTLPVVYVYSVPVFALPWLDLPLTERRSGLLMPRPLNSRQNGLSLEQPVFFTLGQSYDVTFTPGYVFGARRTTLQDPATGEPYRDPATGEPLRFAPPHGVKGPRLATELRYAPSEGTRGRANLGLLYDLLPVRDPVDPSPLRMDPSRIRGLRGELSLQHVQELGHGLHDRVDLAAVSDGYYVRDLVTDVLLRENQYLRSTGALFHRGEDSYAGLELTLRQDLRFGHSALGNDRAPTGEPLRGPGTIQRLPTLRFALPERPIAGPLSASVDVEYTRLAPLLALSGDEGTDGIFDPARPDPDGSQGDGRFQPGEREARDRLDLRPRISAQLAAGRFARFTPYLAWRQDLYVGELTGRRHQRGYPMAGVHLDTELSRTFGGGNDVRHAIRPSVEVRYVPRVFGAAPPVPYDEVDAAVPSDGFLQAVAEVAQRLWLREGTGVRELVRLDLGQGVDLRRGELGDSYARLAASLGVFGLEAIGRYDLLLARPIQLSAVLNVDDGRGDALYARYDRLLTGGSDRTRRGLDALLAGRADPGEPAELLVAGGRASFTFGLGLRYEALLQPLRERDKLSQHTVGVSWTPACDCWTVEAHTTFRPGLGIPDFGVNVTLGRFGSFGAGG